MCLRGFKFNIQLFQEWTSVWNTNRYKSILVHIPICVYISGQDTSLCMTPGDPVSHTQWGILARGVIYSEVSWPEESCTVRYPGQRSHTQWGILARGVIHSEVSWPEESCTVRYPGQRSHTQWGILAWGFMHSEVSWPEESHTVRYPGQRSHAQWGILARGVIHSEVSWSEESCTVRYLDQRSHAQWGILATNYTASQVHTQYNLLLLSDAIVTVRDHPPPSPGRYTIVFMHVHEI